MARFKNLHQWREHAAIAFFIALPCILYWKVFAHNILMFATDGMISFAPKIFVFNQVRSGELPFWNGYLSTGTPVYADPQTAFFYPFHILALIFPPTLYTNLYYVTHLGLAGVFTYLFLKEVSGKWSVAFIGGTFFMVSVCLGGLRKEHPSVYTSIVWLPLILYFIQSFLNTGDKKKLVYSSLAMTMQFFGGTPQWNVYSIIFAFAYFIVGLTATRIGLGGKIKLLVLWSGSYLAYSSILLIPAVELTLHSSRAVSAYFCTYSTTGGLYLMALFPYIFGANIIHPLGIRSAEISIDIYLGIIPLVYAIYAIRYYFRDRFIGFAASALVLTLIYSSGCNIPILQSVFQKIPFLNLFGIQSRVLFIFTFLIVCCAAYGMQDLLDHEKIPRLVHFSLQTAGIILLVAWAVSSVNSAPFVTGKAGEYYSLNSGVYRDTLALALINVLVIGILYWADRKGLSAGYLYNKIALGMLMTATLVDIAQFSTRYIKADFEALVNTREIEVLRSLPAINTSRIVAVYNNINEGYYYGSGLWNNLSMINEIRNLKGFIEFENPGLNTILSQTDSRDGTNTLALLNENSIFSMLSVRYVLIPNYFPEPQSIGYNRASPLLEATEAVSIPGTGELLVFAIPIKIEKGRNYLVQFVVDTLQKGADPFPADVDLFYVDFYGGSEYDNAEQESHIIPDNGTHIYTAILPSGNHDLPPKIELRFVAISKTPLKITDIRMFSTYSHPDYKKIASTGNYAIYENSNARDLLYIPEQVVGINNEKYMLENPDEYPDMDKISYVTGVNSSLITGSVRILSISNNSITAKVSSARGTFVNHSQTFYPGWNAYIDGNKTAMHRVNGVIQGVEVPAGSHALEFRFEPLSLAIGATVSIASLIITGIWILKHARNISAG